MTFCCHLYFCACACVYLVVVLLHLQSFLLSSAQACAPWPSTAVWQIWCTTHDRGFSGWNKEAERPNGGPGSFDALGTILHIGSLRTSPDICLIRTTKLEKRSAWEGQVMCPLELSRIVWSLGGQDGCAEVEVRRLASEMLCAFPNERTECNVAWQGYVHGLETFPYFFNQQDASCKWNEENQFQQWTQIHVISAATLVHSQKEIFLTVNFGVGFYGWFFFLFSFFFFFSRK